jgi:hypothetical protein
MSIQTLLPSSQGSDRYLFRSHSHEVNRGAQKNTSPILRNRYRFSPSKAERYDDVYKFPNRSIELRSQSSDSDRYCFPAPDVRPYPPPLLIYPQSGRGFEQQSTSVSNGTSTAMSDTPYLFSKTQESQRYPSTASSLIYPDGKSPVSIVTIICFLGIDSWTTLRQQSHIVFDSVTDLSARTTTSSSKHRSPMRMDTVTSTSDPFSAPRRSSTAKPGSVRFEALPTPTASRSYLTEARDRLAGKKRERSPESLEQSANKKAPSAESSLTYVSQYYAKRESSNTDQSFLSDNEEQHASAPHISYYNINTNRTHREIMRSLNKSLIDRYYHLNDNQLRSLQQQVRRYLRSVEHQSLQRELNYDLIRCFSSAYLDDIRREELRDHQTRAQMRSYTYEDVQDIHMATILDAYKSKVMIDRERYPRLTVSCHEHQSSSNLTSQISPMSSSIYSPSMMGSFNENMDTQSGGFEPTDKRSFTSVRARHAETGSTLFYSDFSNAEHFPSRFGHAWARRRSLLRDHA